MGSHDHYVNGIGADPTVADPGGLLTIQVDRAPGYLPITTASGARIAVLGPSLVPGQLLTVHLTADGGDLTLILPGVFNAAGNNTCTFNDADDVAVFVSIRNTAVPGTFKWWLLQNIGCTLS